MYHADSRRHVSVGLLLIVTSAGLGCNDLSGLAGKQALPSGIPDPSTLQTRAGALQAYNGVLAMFEAGNITSQGVTSTSTQDNVGTFVEYVLSSGLLTDELGSGELGGNQTNYSTGGFLLLDTRQLLEGTTIQPTDQLYVDLQNLRNSANVAIGALATYDTVDSPALQGQLHALTGYSVLFLADLYCSGVPLSTLDFNRDFTYRAGSTTQQLYQAAVAQFDTAIALSADSVTYLNLARVGKGRASLALGNYDSAAAAVASVPTTYTDQIYIDWGGGVFPGGVFSDVEHLGPNADGVTVTDRQGGTGLPYLSSGDPRTASATWGNNQYGVPQYAPVAYGGAALASGTSLIAPITVASGIEARLIQAEAAYHGVATGSGTWLQQLNALRHANASTQGLPDLTDPGSAAGQVALLFQERAYWLFLTGQRQGDLRRLIRNYSTEGFSANTVYPTGRYPLFGNFQRYGNNVDAPVPVAERVNPLFHGCLARGT